MAYAPPIGDYHVTTTRTGQNPERWSWEIQRKSLPLGIKMGGSGYPTNTAAQVAGAEALADFLSDLSKEEQRTRK
jgi:hypothetical protein